MELINLNFRSFITVPPSHRGGCASRPGNAYTNIITRDFNLDHINLGFSGSGKGEPVMAEYIAEQPMSLFFLDYDHNAPDAEHLAKTHEAFFLL